VVDFPLPVGPVTKTSPFRNMAARPATGRPRTLTAAQERQVFRWINGKDPRQYGFDFGLWTRQIVRELIARRFGVRVSLASIGAVLAR
jgi:transposase